MATDNNQPTAMAIDESSFQASTGVIKIGPCGGHGGSPHDITVEPLRLQSITIRSGPVIYCIGYTYLDNNGQHRTAGPWGGSSSGEIHVIDLLNNEYVIEVSGTFGTYKGYIVVSTLKIVTNLKIYGPYGNWGGSPFSLPVLQGSAIEGMFARSSAGYVDAVGVYVRFI